LREQSRIFARLLLTTGQPHVRHGAGPLTKFVPPGLSKSLTNNVFSSSKTLLQYASPIAATAGIQE
jgi:hypothetical protein